jgi:hypothetical protein
LCQFGQKVRRRFYIDTSTCSGLWDRALIGMTTYTFARVGAVVATHPISTGSRINPRSAHVMGAATSER